MLVIRIWDEEKDDFDDEVINLFFDTQKNVWDAKKKEDFTKKKKKNELGSSVN